MTGDLRPDTDALLRGVMAWMALESPTGNVEAVGRLVNHVEQR